MVSNLKIISTLIKQGSDILVSAGIDTPVVDSELLAAFALGITRSELKQKLIFGEVMPDEVATRFISLIQQRASRVPLQHLTGKAPFRFLELNVGPGVFIARPETESVAGAAIEWLTQQSTNLNQQSAKLNLTELNQQQSANQPKQIAVDLCTGTGAIALAIATECPNVAVYAVELDATAQQWAARNIHDIAPQVQLIKGDAQTALPELNNQVDLVISNPPYLAPHQIPTDPEVHAHDPHLALYGGGPDGLEIPQGIVRAAVRLLKPGGMFVMEHGDNQAAAVATLVANGGFERVVSQLDLTGRDRFITAFRTTRPALTRTNGT